MSYSSSVKIEWTNLIGTNYDEYGNDLTIGTDGFVYVTGYTEGGLDGQANGLYGDAYISKFDTDGNKSWTISLDSESDEHARAITAGMKEKGLDNIVPIYSFQK